MQSERAARRGAGARRGRRAASIRIRADADRERTVLLAEARAQADQLRGEGEATAIKHLRRRLCSKDPHFYAVWRTLQAYRASLGERPDAAGADARRCDPALSCESPPTAPVNQAAAGQPAATGQNIGPVASRAPPRPISRSAPGNFPSMSRCLSRSVRTALAVALALPLVSAAAGRCAPVARRRARRHRTASPTWRRSCCRRWSTWLLHARLCRPATAVRRAGFPGVPAGLAVRAVLQGLPRPQPSRRPGRRSPASRHRNGACRASAPASSSIRPASS